MQGSETHAKYAKYTTGSLLIVVVLLVALAALIHESFPPPEALILIAVGVTGGVINRTFLSDKWVTLVLVAMVAAEFVIVAQLQEPWITASSMILPANACGIPVGIFVRDWIASSKRQVFRDVWVVNGVEQKTAKDAISTAVASLSTWDSRKSGRFFVERNESLFEAVGSPAAGFVVHCTSKVEEESEWRMLGSLADKTETTIPIQSGSAHIPAGIVSDTAKATTALRGYFHHRGPDPQLDWTTSTEVMDFRFG